MPFDKYPIAEIFEAPQGEGVNAGLLTLFIRFAGCNVGKPFTSAQRTELYANNCFLNILEEYQERCETMTGEVFACDTNYQRQEFKSLVELKFIIEESLAPWVSFTGGEPLMYDITPLVAHALEKKKSVNIETSGTKPLPPNFHQVVSSYWKYQVVPHKERVHLTVSPKKGVLPQMLEDADEIKLLIGNDFDETKVPMKIWKSDKVVLQPINLQDKIDSRNVKRCLELQSRYTKARISLQLHKILGTR